MTTEFLWNSRNDRKRVNQYSNQMTTEFLQNFSVIWSEFCNWFDQYSNQKIRWPLNSFNILIRKLDDHRILMKFYRNDQYSDQKVRWPQNSYEIIKVWAIFRPENNMTHIPFQKLGGPRILIHRELKSDRAIGHFAEPLWRLKTGHFTT